MAKVLVTGATGYVGGRLIPELIEAGYEVRAMVRSAEKAATRNWDSVEVFEADALDPASLEKALDGVDFAYYLIHSMTSAGKNFFEKDIECATNFANACESQGVQRIIYLGGLGNTGPGLSEHLESRQYTGDALRSTSVPVTELRAAIVIGSGSASFEIIKDLCRKLPIMITPRWVKSKCEPIAIRTLLAYLVAVLNEERTTGEILDVGGGEIFTYAEMMRECAALMGKSIIMIPVPVLSPKLSSYWLNLVTSVPLSLAQPLVEGLKNDVVCRDQKIREWIDIDPLPYREAVRLALIKDRNKTFESRWTDATTSSAQDKVPIGHDFYIDSRSITVNASPALVYSKLESIGGPQGWFHANWLWKLRAALDWLVGGVGMRRGRPARERLAVGDPLDFWRVEEATRNERLTLRAEMKLPGVARLSFIIDPINAEEKTLLTSEAQFWPKNLLGRLYWYSVMPLHSYVFRGLLRNIKARSEA